MLHFAAYFAFLEYIKIPENIVWGLMRIISISNLNVLFQKQPSEGFSTFLIKLLKQFLKTIYNYYADKIKANNWFKVEHSQNLDRF